MAASPRAAGEMIGVTFAKNALPNVVARAIGQPTEKSEIAVAATIDTKSRVLTENLHCGLLVLDDVVTVMPPPYNPPMPASTMRWVIIFYC
jgi:hypothetical protein